MDNYYIYCNELILLMIIRYTSTTKEPYPIKTCGANGEWCGCGMSDEYYEKEHNEKKSSSQL